MIIYDKNGQPYDADLVPGPEHRTLLSELAAARKALDEAINVYLSEPDGSVDHTEICHDMYAILERATRESLFDAARAVLTAERMNEQLKESAP